MCDPVSMISMALSAASTVTGFVGARNQAAQQNEMARRNEEAVQESLRQQYTDTQTRQIQEEEAAAVQQQDISRDARAARASALAAAGEGGVSGLSVDALLADIYGTEGTALDRINQNTGFTTENLQAEMRGLRARATDRLNSIPRAYSPSPFAAALKIGGGALNSYNNYAERTSRNR